MRPYYTLARAGDWRCESQHVLMLTAWASPFRRVFYLLYGYGLAWCRWSGRTHVPCCLLVTGDPAVSPPWVRSAGDPRLRLYRAGHQIQEEEPLCRSVVSQPSPGSFCLAHPGGTESVSSSKAELPATGKARNVCL